MTGAGVVGWRMFYTDGRQYDSVTSDWLSVPDDGVLVLVLYLDEYSGDGNVQHRHMFDGDDWYFHIPGTDLFGSNNDDPDETRERYPGAVVKRGKWTDPATYKAVKEQAMEADCP